MGGSNQPLAHAQFVSNVVDYGMNVQAAVEVPRFTIHSESLNCDIAIESRVKPEVLDQLRLKGHNLNVRNEYSSWMGRGQAVLHNSKTGVNFAGSDPRADGAAVPEPVPQPPKDRKSTRLNSSHMSTSYAVFCLKKKSKTHEISSSISFLQL